jgi:hypothetical protein
MRALGFLVLIVGAGYWLYTGYEASGGMTERTYYEACWEMIAKTKGFEEPTPSTPYQAGQWKQCGRVALRAMYENGFMFAGREAGADSDRLRRACPDMWSEVPMAGPYYLYVKDMEAEGGVSGLEAILPASVSNGRWARKRWPQCDAERKRQGYPKIIEKSDGAFAWEKPCPKCK